MKNQLRYFRERLAISQRSLAETSGVSQITISRIETKKTLPHPGTRRKLAHALQIGVEKLFQPVRTR